MPLLVLCCSVVLSLSGAREPFGSSIAKRREAEHRRSKTSGDVLGLRNPRLDIILGRILARRIERVENASYFFFVLIEIVIVTDISVWENLAQQHFHFF